MTSCSKTGTAHCVLQDDYFYTQINFDYRNEIVLKEEEIIKILNLELSKEELEMIAKEYQIKNDDYLTLSRTIDYRKLSLEELEEKRRLDNYLENGYLNIFKTLDNYEKFGFVCKY